MKQVFAKPDTVCIRLFYFIVLGMLYSLSLFSQNPPLDQTINSVIELTASERYDAALETLNQQSKLFKKEPAIPFLQAMVLQTAMMDLETRRWKDDFFQYADEAIQLAEKRLAHHPDDLDAAFFWSAAVSYQSYYYAKEKQYFKSYKLIQDALDKQEWIAKQDSQYCDVYLGIGSYLYWRSRLVHSLTWLPFFQDRRAEGIQLVEKAMRCGRYSRWAAISSLAWMYIKENEFDQAIEYAQKGLEHYPNARSFLWPLGDANFQNGNFEQALTIYHQILESVMSAKINNGYNEILLYLKIARCHDHLNQPHKALMFCDKALERKPAKEVRERCKEKKEQALELRQSILETTSNP